MNLRFLVLIGLSLNFCSTAVAQDQPDYFPLQVGNEWIYRSTFGPSYTTNRIDRTETVGDKTYFVMVADDASSGTWLRSDGAGHIFQYEPQFSRESILYDFTQQPTSTVPFDNSQYTISRNGNYSGPIGDFSTMLLLGRTSSLSTSQQGFLPFVGRVYGYSKSTTGSAGLVPALVDNLVYARLGDVTVVTAREYSFSLTIDRPVYNLGFGNTEDCQTTNFPGQNPSAPNYRPCLLARLTVRNSRNEPLDLVFPTSQIYDIELRNPNGDTIYRLSEHRQYEQVVRDLTVGPGQRDFTETIPLYTEVNFTPQLLPAGKYQVVATLAGGNGASSALTFEIRLNPPTSTSP